MIFVCYLLDDLKVFLRKTSWTVERGRPNCEPAPHKCFAHSSDNTVLGHVRSGGSWCRKTLPVCFRRLSRCITDLKIDAIWLGYTWLNLRRTRM